MFELFMGIIGLLYFLYWAKRKEFTKMINHFSGPKTMPFIGNVLECSFELDVMFSILRKYAKTYNTTYRLWAANIGTINIVTPRDTQIVLSSSTEIKKSFIYSFFHPWLGTGLLTSEGEKWHQRRKILEPAFYFTILKRFVEIFNEHNDQLINLLQEECQKPKTNVTPLITQCTLNTICETAMGTNINSNSSEDKRYFQALYGISKIIIQRIICPVYHNKFLFNCFPMGWKQRKYVKTLHGFTKGVIRNRQENFQGLGDLERMDDGVNRKTRLAMLDLLIDAKNHKGIIDDKGIREEVDTFMFEGHDTVGLALCFSLMVLANHEDIQEKIFEELYSVFGTSFRQPTYIDLQNMKYLEMCIKECLRLYPSVPFVSRELKEDLLLSTGIAPRGCVVNVHIYDLHRNPDVFPEPEKFDPDRFLPDNVQRRHPFSFVPFSAGPRNCIGRNFAMLEMKAMISSILRNYNLEAVTAAEDLQLVTDIVLRNKDPIYVKFIERINKI